jgi:hypothetical protein
MADSPDEPTKRLSVEIPDRLHHQLRLQAVEQRTTVAAIIREMLEREIERGRHLTPPREAKARKARAA